MQTSPAGFERASALADADPSTEPLDVLTDHVSDGSLKELVAGTAAIGDYQRQRFCRLYRPKAGALTPSLLSRIYISVWPATLNTISNHVRFSSRLCCADLPDTRRQAGAN
jgi:hypothetical protein